MDTLLIALIVFVLFFVYFNTDDNIENKPVYNKFKTFFTDCFDALKKLLS